MPIFEFLCTQCKKQFEQLVRSMDEVDEVTCTACGSKQVEKQVSPFTSGRSAGRPSESSGPNYAPKKPFS